MVVALDDRTKNADRVYELADELILWKSAGNCESAYRFIPTLKDDFILLISDDEEPSELLWRLALEPPYPARFGIPVLPIRDRKLWRPDVGIQERLFWRQGWKWVGGFEGHSESPAQKVVLTQNPGAIVWHYYLDAPREEREAKAARYEGLAPGEHRSRLIYEDRPDELIPLDATIAAHLPKEN